MKQGNMGYFVWGELGHGMSLYYLKLAMREYYEIIKAEEKERNRKLAG